MQEGLFLYDRGLDPYDGGIFHQAPLLLPLFSLLPSPSLWAGRIASILLYTALDVLSADCLYDIAKSGAAAVSSVYRSPRADRSWQPESVVAVYLFNPFTLLACLGRPTTTFTVFFVMLSVRHACQAKITTTAFALAIASYLSLHPALLLPPIGLLCYDRLCHKEIGANNQTDKPAATSKKVAVDQRSLPAALPFAIVLAITFSASIGFLLGLSRLLLPSWQFISSVYMTPLTLPDLTPNPGLWWYFFIEMFDAFRGFFLGVFWLHMLSYSVPFCLRFRKQPLVAVVLMTGIIAVFQPYANVGDAGAWLSCLCLLGHIFECMFQTSEISALSLTFYSVLNPPLYISRAGSFALRLPPRTGFPSSMDIRWIGKRQLLLCDYARVEPGAAHSLNRYRVCRAKGRMGGRASRRQRQGGSPDVDPNITINGTKLDAISTACS